MDLEDAIKEIAVNLNELVKDSELTSFGNGYLLRIKYDKKKKLLKKQIIVFIIPLERIKTGADKDRILIDYSKEEFMNYENVRETLNNFKRRLSKNYIELYWGFGK